MMSSVLPADSALLSPHDAPNTIAWDLPMEEESTSEEGFEDERILTEGILLKTSDGASIRHGSRLNDLEKAHHWEVSAPPPRI